MYQQLVQETSPLQITEYFGKKGKNNAKNVAITYAFRIIGDCRKLANIPFNFEEHKSRYYGIVKLEFKISYLTSRD